MKGFIVLLFVFGSALCQEGDGKLTMVYPTVREPYYTDDRTSLDITCILSKSGGKIGWLFNAAEDGSGEKSYTNGANVTYSLLNGVNRTVSNLYFYNLTKEEQGRYRCFDEEKSSTYAEVKVIVTEIRKGDYQLGTDNSTTAELKCEVIGEDTADVWWFKNGTRLLNGAKYNISSRLVIKDAGYNDIGPYECHYNSSGSNELNVREVYIYAKPYIKKFDKPKNMVQGDPVTILCEVQAYPLAQVWWFNQTENQPPQPVDLSGADKRINVTNYQGTTNASLKINDLEFQDRGIYTCEARNALGGHNESVEVKVKDKLAALWPFLGICAEVAILCTIIFIYERRRAKKMEQEEEKEEAGRHLTNSHTSKGDEEVRHRNK